MADKVVDASALAAIAFQEPEEIDLRAQLAGHRWLSSSLLPYEMANVCWKKMRKHASDRAKIFDQFLASRDVPVELHDVDFSQVVPLADQCDLTVYDASYLWLARRYGLDLVTLDGELAKAAKSI